MCYTKITTSIFLLDCGWYVELRYNNNPYVLNVLSRANSRKHDLEIWHYSSRKPMKSRYFFYKYMGHWLSSVWVLDPHKMCIFW